MPWVYTWLQRACLAVDECARHGGEERSLVTHESPGHHKAVTTTSLIHHPAPPPPDPAGGCDGGHATPTISSPNTRPPATISAPKPAPAKPPSPWIKLLISLVPGLLLVTLAGPQQPRTSPINHRHLGLPSPSPGPSSRSHETPVMGL